MPEPKCVILRLGESNFNTFDMYEAVRAYLECHDCSPTELERFRHWIHIRPSNDRITAMRPEGVFVVDLEMDGYSGMRGGGRGLRGIFRMSCLGGLPGRKNELYYQNLLRKVREVTDESYVWGTNEREKRMRDRVLAERSQSELSEGESKAEQQ